MSNKNPKWTDKISEDDMQSFREEVADVRPLITENRIETAKAKPSPKPRHGQDYSDTEEATDINLMSDPVDLRDAVVDDVLSFARAGIQQKVQKKLRRGELPIEDVLDLHGYTIVEAKIAIQDFLYECSRQHIRYILIIHGKGYRSEQKIPILKTHVAYWLPQHRDVLAFSSALPKDGGTGAIYVLLKSSK
ncbi:MAG: Smr/MutS family protein [Gammaproteobacteria bacterium]|nr:Smr/MutS family protein [Gammaproteobacteria bacterium]